VTTPKLLLIDGHSLAFRSYFAFSKGRDGGLRTSTGIPTSVCFGFVKALLEAVEMENPDHIAIAFDLGGPTFRHTADATYKANRPETPQDFIPDLNNLREFLTAMNLPIVIAEGYEADDVIGTLARQACQQQWSVRILSGDRDLFQLVDDHEYVKILYTGSAFTKGTPREFGIQEVKEKLNVFPNQVVDFKALCGDTSDNIPGVKGIGEKTAAQLLETYGTLEKVYESIEDLKGAVKKRLEDGKESALHSQWLAQIHLGVPIEVTPNDCQFLPFEQSAIEPWIEKLEFRAFTGKLEALRCRLSGEAPAKISSTKNNKAVIPSESGDTWFFSPEDTAKSQQNIQQGADSPIAPQIITTPEQLHELVDILLACKDADRPVAWDTETTSLEPRDAKLVGIGCCWQAGSDHLAYIPLGHQAGQQMDTGAVLDTLRPILESDAYPKVLQNAKYDRLVFQHQGINLAGVVFDTMLASYVLNPDAKHNLSELGIQHLGIISQSYGDLVPKGKTIADLDISSVAQYCGMDVYVTFHLVEILRPKLKTSPTLWNLFTQVEVPLEPVLAAMETWGIRVDADYLRI
jgi:DNA polymerase I